MNQMTLGELISALKRKNAESDILFDFAGFRPNDIRSWRGDYAQLAVGYSKVGQIKTEAFLKELEKSVGRTFQGYKGGNFLMKENTRLWVANWGESHNTGLVDVNEDDGRVILKTEYCAY